MKITKKITLSLLTCIAFSYVAMHCFSNDGNNMWRGAAIGGLAGGRRGAGIGLGVGMATDVMGNAASNNQRRRYDDDRYYDKRRNRKDNNKRSRRDLEQENEELRQRLDELENE